MRRGLLGGATGPTPISDDKVRHAGDDQQEETLVAATLNFQRLWDLDFIKLPVSSTYAAADWGVKHEYQGSPNGDRAYLERAIKKPQDWSRIAPLDVEKGSYGWTLKALRSVLQQKDKDTPLIVTMFNPLSVAYYLAGDETCAVHLRTHPREVEAALAAITETELRFIRALLGAGADGVIKVWDATTGQVKLNLTGHADAVMRIAVSGNGVSTTDENGLTVGVKLTFGAFNALFGGDLVGTSPAIEPTLIGHVGEVEIYKVHHHGSIEDPALLGAYRQAVSPAAR